MVASCFYQNYREVRLLVIHCSATRYDRDFPVEALRASHKARGFADIGYHFYVTRDGATRGGWTRASNPPTPVPTPKNAPSWTCSAN